MRGWELALNVSVLARRSRNFIIYCQMLLSEDLHIALTSATNQPRENNEIWLNSLESLPELDPDSERMLQFNQVYNRFASTLSEDSICSSKYIKEASPTIPTKATPQNQKLKSIGNGKGRNTNKPSARTTIPAPAHLRLQRLHQRNHQPHQLRQRRHHRQPNIVYFLILP